MAYCHGAGYALVYNDRFADLLGDRHPPAWGQRAAAVMPEIWSRPGYGQSIDAVFAGGPSFHDEAAMLDLLGREQPQPDWAYPARSYSAVRDKSGSVLGVLIVVVQIAPVMVLPGGAEHGGQGSATWHGIDRWDESATRQPLIWSGFRAGPWPPHGVVSEPEIRSFAEGAGERIAPINGPDIAASIGELGMRRHLPDVQTTAPATPEQSDTTRSAASGQFYDVFGMADGRIAVTIGEVIGAGPSTGAVMAQVKVALRAAALTSSDPNVIFSALDEVVSRLDRSWPAQPSQVRGSSTRTDRPGFGGELLVTALLGVFDPDTGDLLLASAGHFPPALVRRPPATHAQAGSGPGAQYAQVQPGPPLGVTGARPALHTTLGEGDALVAHTGGLLRRRSQSLAQGRSALLGILNTMRATAARSISQHVVDTLIGDKGLEHGCALLVVVRQSRAHKVTSVLVAPHMIAVQGARRWARCQLGAWGLGEETISSAVLCISELVTNVVQHAGTPARVTMELADQLMVIVEDTGTWSAPRTGPQDRSAARGRGLALVAALSDAMGHARGIDGSTVWFELKPGGDRR